MRRSLRDFLNATWHKWRLGFNPNETWALDWSIAKLIYPRLVYFKKHNNGYPASLTESEWDEILGKMIKAFEILSKEDFNDCTVYPQVSEGLKLFAEYYEELWW